MSDFNVPTKVQQYPEPILSLSSSSRSLDLQLLDDKDVRIESPNQDLSLKRINSPETVPCNQCRSIQQYLFCDAVDYGSFEWSESTWSETTFTESSSSLLRDANTVQRLASWDSTPRDLGKTGCVRFANPLVTAIKNRQVYISIDK